VPLGAFLSGGLDSSTIVAIMAEHSKNPVKTFTITFDKEGSRYDEAPHAELVSRHFGTTHNVLQAGGNAADLLPTMVSHFDEPFGNPTALLVYVLSKLIREHVTVALAGDGGDELFAGYARYQGILLSRSYRMIPMPLRRVIAGAVDKFVPESTSGFHLPRRIREFAMGNTLDPVSMYADWISCFSQAERTSLYTSETRREVGGHDSLAHIRELFAECPDDDLASRAAYSDMMSFLPNNVLQYSDRMSMAHALEIRVPFTDPRLIELMARVPRSLKVTSRDTKILMRKSMQGILPDSILERGKIGFNPPMGVWLTTTLQKLMDEYLSEETIRSRGLFDPAVVRKMREDHVRGRRDMTWRLWLLLVMEQWMRMY
jgi:asparagine synthase (glutamine-hydrolysing)